MIDDYQPSDSSQKLHPNKISELNIQLIHAERGEIKLNIDQILHNVMEIVYFKALQESEKPVVDLNIARVYKRGFEAAEKNGFNTQQYSAAMAFLLQGFQRHIDRYVKNQQKDIMQTLDVS